METVLIMITVVVIVSRLYALSVSQSIRHREPVGIQKIASDYILCGAVRFHACIMYDFLNNDKQQ